MSGKTSIGLPVLFCPRKPKIATSAIPKRRKIKKKPRSISVLVNNGDVLTAAAFEKVPRFHFREARIARLDGEEEAVIARAAESFPVKDRMMPTRQSVHNNPGEERGKSGEEHSQLEHDWKKRRNRAPGVRLPVHDQRIDDPGWA